MVGGPDFLDEAAAGGREDDTVGAAVRRVGRSADELALFEAVEEAGGVGAVHEEAAGEFRLREPVRVEVEEVEQVELGGAEVPGSEEGTGGGPDFLGCMQQFDERLIPQGRRVHDFV